MRPRVVATAAVQSAAPRVLTLVSSSFEIIPSLLASIAWMTFSTPARSSSADTPPSPSLSIESKSMSARHSSFILLEHDVLDGAALLDVEHLDVLGDVRHEWLDHVESGK